MSGLLDKTHLSEPPPMSPFSQVSDAVYRLVYDQAKGQYDTLVTRCELERPQLQSTARTDMDQIIQSKEHLASKIKGGGRQRMALF